MTGDLNGRLREQLRHDTVQYLRDHGGWNVEAGDREDDYLRDALSYLAARGLAVVDLSVVEAASAPNNTACHEPATDNDLREQVARIIDPFASRMPRSGKQERRNDSAHSKADRILGVVWEAVAADHQELIASAYAQRDELQRVIEALQQELLHTRATQLGPEAMGQALSEIVQKTKHWTPVHKLATAALAAARER